MPRVQIVSHSPPRWKRCSTVGRWSRKPVNVRDPGTSGVRLLPLPPDCKRRREGMAPVRKTGARKSQWVRSPPLAPDFFDRSHDPVVRMSACRAECESSILSGTAISLLTLRRNHGTIEPRYEASGHKSEFCQRDRGRTASGYPHVAGPSSMRFEVEPPAFGLEAFLRSVA